MVNWKDAATIAEQFLEFIEITHFCAGIFLWEFLSTLNYEYTVYTRKRPFRWTLIIYLLIRYATMGTILCYMINTTNISEQFDCMAWLKATYAFSYGSLALASALIGMRAIALWNRHWLVFSLNVIAWLVNLGFMIFSINGPSGISLNKIVRDPISKSCVALNTSENAINWVATFIADFVLLVSMLWGVLRTKNEGSLWRLLYHQGVVWTALATIAEVPTVTFLELNLNDPMNLMFQPIALTILIGATRLYRDLAKFGNPVTSTQK
ncbi:hypothetical protein EV421DRAFT_195808 [Armillaria borealis]|uniref:Uncharacterized protein n=1 Tax=Armillaria borealis TaxID=47425 RepID=A0AA39MVA0_9AGAR|nr:hypothetical protein EV421DRAFT_195808 [Armillaria borealis]